MEENKRFWKITPVLTGSFGMVRDDIKYEGGDPEISGYVPSVLFLLESGGEQVIVDTGFGDAKVCRDKLGLFIKREKTLDQIFSEAGIDRESIRHVILTHLHWDHIGNVSMFPNANYYCQKKEWIYAREHPEEETEEWLRYLWQQEERVIFIDDCQGNTILPGIKVQYAGGHTAGSQMAVVQTRQGTAVIPGDVVMTYRNFRERIPVGLCQNKEECREALKTIADIKPDRIFPSHDFEVFGKEGEIWES